MTKQELTECIDRYGRDIYSFCRHLTGNVQEAEELMITTYTLNEDGTVTFAAWVPKEVSIYLQ